jgi:hypothetical protein
VSGLLAITPGFEAPPAPPVSAAGTASQSAAAQTSAAQTTSTRDRGQIKVSVFANLIHELAHEAATLLPAAVASPKTAPRVAPQSPQQAGTLPGLPAPVLPTLALLSPGDGRTLTAQATADSIPNAPATDGDKPAAALPPLPSALPPAPSEGTRRQPKSEVSAARENSTPVTIDATLFMPVVPPISLKLPSFIAHPGEGAGDTIHLGGDDRRTTFTPDTAREQTLDLRPAPALELRIRTQDQAASEQTAAPVAVPTTKPAPTDQQTDTELPLTVMSGTQPRPAEQIVHAFASAPGPAAIEPAPAQPASASTVAIPLTPVNPPPAINSNANSVPAPPPQASATHLADEPVSRQQEQHAQPLRSISLEFAPDGAQDVRVRLAERSGDVHISLHSTDAALSGRLSDGVHELVGTLANAGYDAQAWSHGQGRQNHSEQNQAPPDDPRRNRRGNSADPGAEEFDAIMQQPNRIKP